MTPEDTVERYFECLRSERYLEAAKLVSVVARKRFRDHEAPQLRPVPAPSREDYSERFPDVPAEVVEHWFEQSRRHPPVTLATYFARVTSEEELDALIDQELLARHIEATDHARLARANIDALMERYPEHADELKEVRDRQKTSWAFRALGTVVLGEVAYVLHGADPNDAWEKHEPVPHVAVLRRYDGSWKLATDPSPYRGSVALLGPVPVTGPDGERLWLDPVEPGSG